MLSRIAQTAARRSSNSILAAASSSSVRASPIALSNTLNQIDVSKRNFSVLKDNVEASEAWKQSCYMAIDFTISEDASVYEAVQRFSAFNIGCLVTTDADGNTSGVISERDYINKVALLGASSKDLKIKDISTKATRMVVGKLSDSVEECMSKMLTKDIRHLPLIDEEGKVVGLLSVKDLVKALVEEKEKTIKTLSDFALGKGGHFGAE
eukprot:CAMPEP_0178953644 /NCGR_PEP_ID=MMETSP0789-20121207/8537_1 /TAXON_ID=3005 /ORGANISM="Rhizosolenia setigera, Strain CCMP 1694" /LENGTH=208 /DNA_ID=CAMNT_0020634933 /DNA_START=90 /DNA_END=716 /DNA_ORIENTATION=+